MQWSSRGVSRGVWGVGLLAAGYLLGAGGVFQVNDLNAQAPAQGPSDETIDKIREANNVLNSAMLALKNDGGYESVIEDVNAFAVLAGGVNARADLESGRGVDPVTFAGLYAGRAIGDVQKDLSKDEEGRLLYKNKLVRMYSIGRLERMFAARSQILGEEEE